MRRLLFLLPMMLGAQVLAPTQNSETRFARGQNVVPAYEGWLRNADGSFTFVFGYFNRNWEEELVIPAGAENKLEPGDPDRGQPTLFLPRRQGWLFRVQVPKDWGQKELVWTLISRGRTEKAYASLAPQEEITERMIATRGGLTLGDDDPNLPPTITIPVVEGRVGAPLALTALVMDDGLPMPRVVAAPRPGAQTNTNVSTRPGGLSVTWYEYRGPAPVVWNSPGAVRVTNGRASTNVRFTVPGTYILRAVANDGALSRTAEVTLTVTAPSR